MCKNKLFLVLALPAVMTFGSLFGGCFQDASLCPPLGSDQYEPEDNDPTVVYTASARKLGYVADVRILDGDQLYLAPVEGTLVYSLTGYSASVNSNFSGGKKNVKIVNGVLNDIQLNGLPVYGFGCVDYPDGTTCDTTNLYTCAQADYVQLALKDGTQLEGTIQLKRTGDSLRVQVDFDWSTRR